LQSSSRSQTAQSRPPPTSRNCEQLRRSRSRRSPAGPVADGGAGRHEGGTAARAGERRYTIEDLAHLQRILELREVLGMNLDEIREFLVLESRLDELRVTYRATKGERTATARAEQKATLEEAMRLNESLAQQISAKLSRLEGFRAKLEHDAQRCRELLDELG
jgi:DNA-binding transcriptional MerR regulator